MRMGTGLIAAVRQVPPGVKVVLGGDLLSSLGNGATYPFLVVLLVRADLPTAVAAGVLVSRAMVAMIGAGVGGTLADRIGARSAVLAALTAAGICAVIMGFSIQPIVTVVAILAFTFFSVLLLSALDALLGMATPAESRELVFAWKYTVVHLGAALGAVGASITLGLTGDQLGLQILYLFDGGTFLLYAVFVGVLTKKPEAPAAVLAGIKVRTPGSYGQVARDAVMRRICMLIIVVVAVGFGQLQIGLPALVASRGQAHFLGWMAATNMAAVVLMQLPAQRWLTGRRRSYVLSLALGAMALGWALVAAWFSGLPQLVLASFIFTIGEVLFTPVWMATVNDLATPALRGRYNGASNFAYMTGTAIAALVSGVLLATGEIAALFPICSIVLAFSALLIWCFPDRFFRAPIGVASAQSNLVREVHDS
ncbi:MFS transporter [Streptomyces collinus]|uniref:MFS transporter n=1 Tax=Streptomyces collinus TaxID=42684 RepID=UPI0036B6DC7E